MGFFQKYFKRKKKFSTSELLSEAEKELNNSAFSLVRKEIEMVVHQNQHEIKKFLSDKSISYEWIYSAIANVAGDMLESGDFHLYRGVLDPNRKGQELLKLYDSSIDKLVELDFVDVPVAINQKKALRDNLKTIG